MFYDISEFINPNDPLYQKGCLAIKKRDFEKLEEVIKHPDFDSASYEARALLFKAAEDANINAFHRLGDANVVLFDPLKILKERPHILSTQANLSNVYLIQDSTPLHTLLKKLNLRAYSSLDLETHFKYDDIERALNTYSFKDKGTPLEIGWKNFMNSVDFLKKQSKNNNRCITLIPTDFINFCIDMLYFKPDLTAPTLVEEPLLYQKAIQRNDTLTLRAIADLTCYTLNHIGYKYPKPEFDALYPYTKEFISSEMKKGFEEQPIKRISFFNKAKQFLERLTEHQKS